MPNNPKKSLDRINQVLAAWQTLRPEKSFGGLTLEQFRARVQPSFDARTTLETLNHQVVAAQDRRDDADEASLDATTLVINGVKGDPTEGPDGELYEAMGFVRESERRSGLTRARRAAAAPAK